MTKQKILLIIAEIVVILLLFTFVLIVIAKPHWSHFIILLIMKLK